MYTIYNTCIYIYICIHVHIYIYVHYTCIYIYMHYVFILETSSDSYNVIQYNHRIDM